MLYWGKELVFVKLSVDPVEQKSGRYSDCEADYIGSTALYARSKAAERDYHSSRGGNYADYAVEYERIVPVHQAGDRFSHEREPYSRARAGVAPRFVRAVEDIKQLAETFVIDSGTVARKLYSRPVLLARDADDAVADIFIAVFSAVVEKICHYPEKQFLSIHLEQHKNRPINHRSNFL